MGSRACPEFHTIPTEDVHKCIFTSFGPLGRHQRVRKVVLAISCYLLTANSNTMGPYSTHMDAEFDAGFIVK